MRTRREHRNLARRLARLVPQKGKTMDISEWCEQYGEELSQLDDLIELFETGSMTVHFEGKVFVLQLSVEELTVG